MNMKAWAENIIKDNRVSNLPVLYFPVVRNLELDLPSSVKSSEHITMVMKEVIEKYPDTIAAITGMDLTVDAEAFGAEVNYSDIQAPNLKDCVLRSKEEIGRLKVPDVHSGRVDLFTQACVLAKEEIKDRPIFGGMLGPFSLAANLLDLTECMKMTMKDKEQLHDLLEICCEWLIRRAKAYKKAGANGVFIAEPTAGLLSPKACDAFSSQYIKRMVELVQDDSFCLILHNCGRVEKSIQSMCSTGCMGLHFGNGVEMKSIMQAIPSHILVFGNLDPSSVFFMGTHETVYQKTTELLNEMENYSNFVLSSGCDLAPSVNEENILAYYQACRDYNQSKNKDKSI